MRILFLAPQPFFQERGTPIAVRLALEVLSGRGGDAVDLLTYHEGEDVSIPGVKLRRIAAPQWLRNIGPGLSFKKLICDIFFFFAAIRLVLRARNDQYAVVHAVEEAVFIALFLKWMAGIPYIYDMDSSLALQVTEKWFVLRPLKPLLALIEKFAVRNSLAVVPVCDALAVIARSHGSKETHVLRDISLLNRGEPCTLPCDLRSEAKISPEDVVILYIGNLERYQGIGLLLESFARVTPRMEHTALVIIGGRTEHIDEYLKLSEQLGVSSHVHFLGPRPVSTLDLYLKQADVLVSPRVKGNNTPMKIYSYLHSGKAVVATDLPTHTQVMNSDVAVLARPEPEAFADALLRVVQSEPLRQKLGSAAYALAESRYTFDIFSKQLRSIYERVGSRIAGVGKNELPRIKANTGG